MTPATETFTLPDTGFLTSMPPSRNPLAPVLWVHCSASDQPSATEAFTLIIPRAARHFKHFARLAKSQKPPLALFCGVSP
jgi:hypothetical protein